MAVKKPLRVDEETGEIVEGHDNMRHWRALGTTDPAHTKKFERAGGFRGTATRPIWTELRMTQHFGPCGIGWGTGEPEFKLIEAGDEILVFCTVALWYRDSETTENAGGDRSAVAMVYGVGGDKVLMKWRDSFRTNDEAYKSAYTDAMSNAMKHIGVMADVHMGMFEDNKYLDEARRHFAESETPPEPKVRPHPVEADRREPLPVPMTPAEADIASAKMAAQALRDSIDACTTEEALDSIMEGPLAKEATAILRRVNGEESALATLGYMENRIRNRRVLLKQETA